MAAPELGSSAAVAIAAEVAGIAVTPAGTTARAAVLPEPLHRVLPFRMLINRGPGDPRVEPVPFTVARAGADPTLNRPDDPRGGVAGLSVAWMTAVQLNRSVHRRGCSAIGRPAVDPAAVCSPRRLDVVVEILIAVPFPGSVARS